MLFFGADSAPNSGRIPPPRSPKGLRGSNLPLSIAKSAESFVTRFRSHGQRKSLIPKEEIYALPDEILDQKAPQLRWMKLLDEELKALETYMAPI
jgi:hypothetical protein